MTTTNNDPEAIRREIDRTRGRLSDDVEVLTESVRPSSVARRTVGRASSRAGRIKETVMGSAHGMTHTGSEQAHQAADAVREAPDLARRQTRGNPLAAGAVALAAGWLIGSILPASQKERDLAGAARDKAEPLVDEARSVARETADHLKDPAQEALESVKETAREGVDHLKDESADRAQDLRATASGDASQRAATPPAST